MLMLTILSRFFITRRSCLELMSIFKQKYLFVRLKLISFNVLFCFQKIRTYEQVLFKIKNFIGKNSNSESKESNLVRHIRKAFSVS